jgi:hypothetical protein
VQLTDVEAAVAEFDQVGLEFPPSVSDAHRFFVSARRDRKLTVERVRFDEICLARHLRSQQLRSCATTT